MRTSKAIGYILIILLIFAAFALLANKNNADNTTEFGVYVSGKPLSDSITLPLEDIVVFEVKGTSSYSIAVVPNDSNYTNFAFYVDGERHLFGDETDYTSGFDISQGKNSFTITNSGICVSSILQQLYNGHNVEVDENLVGFEDYFKLVVTSAEGKTVETVLHLDKVYLEITLDKGGVLFGCE